MRKLSTGEPCAGEPPARFGGRGESGKGSSLPPIGSMEGFELTIHGTGYPLPGGYDEIGYKLTK